MPNRKDRAQALAARSRFWIDDLHVQPDRCVVMRGKQEIKLELRMMEVLVLLAEHAGETITKERLLVEVWGSEIYGDSPVNKVISLLRDLIGDNARNPRYIETVSKVGFRMIATITLPEDYRRMPASPWKEGSPYVGLSAYDAKHSPVFCGRGRSISDLLRAIRSQMENGRRFVMIVGASGCGKTSLLRAGAIPLLTKSDGFEGLRALSVADCDLAAAHVGDPLTPLVAALATWTLGHDPVFPPQTTEQLKSLLCDSPNMIAGLVAESLRRHSGCNLDEESFAHLLLTIDHAETLVASADIDTKAREAFERLVLVLCDCPHVLVTMITRSDFYPKLTEALSALAERKAGGGHLDVLPPRYGEIGEIIRTPAWKANLTFELDADSRDRLDDVLRDAAVVQPDALPLLQHTLQTLYEYRNEQQQLAFATYHEIGGLEGAIAHRAEQVFTTLPADAQASLDTVLTRLIVVQPDSDAISARRAYADDFRDDAETLVGAFIAARLFVGDHSDGRATVGVAHEALLRRWPKAVEWTQDNRRLLQAKARLQRTAARWVQEGRQDDDLLNPGRPLGEAQEVAQRFPEDYGEDERQLLFDSERAYRKKRRARSTAVIALAFLTAISLTFAAVAWQQRNVAEKRERESRRLSEYLLGPLADELRRREILGLLGNIGKEAIDYLEDRDLSSLNPSQLANTARAYRTVGEALLGTESVAQAKTSFKQAYALSNLAVKGDPKNEAAIFERGNASYWIGYLEFMEKRYDAAQPHWCGYHDDSGLLTSLSPKNPDWQQEASYAENVLGTLALRRGDTDPAMHHFEESLSKKEIAISILPNKLDYRYDYIDSLSWVASTLEASGKLTEASAEYDRQISMLASLIAAHKDANRWRSRLANYKMLSARLEIGMGNAEKAAALASDAVRIMEQLVSISPDNSDWAKDLAKTRLILVDAAELKSDQPTKATQLALVLEEFSRLDKQARSGISWRWIDAKARFAQSILNIDTPPTVRTDKAIADLATLADETDNEDILESYALALLLRGNAHARHANKALAESDCASAIAAIEKTNWKQNSSRSWIWSEAMIRIGNREQATSVDEWLASIGYMRRRH